MPKHARLILMCFAVCAPVSLGAQSFCDGPEAALGPSRDLYCIELVPAVGIRAGAGRVELGRTPGPFTVDVTADGRLRYTPTLTLSGLGPPHRLVAYAAYVAWVAPPTMDVVTAARRRLQRTHRSPRRSRSTSSSFSSRLSVRWRHGRCADASCSAACRPALGSSRPTSCSSRSVPRARTPVVTRITRNRLERLAALDDGADAGRASRCCRPR